MRQVVLDTETTGLEVSDGHRVIEIGCVELINRRASGRTFHTYLRPDREIDLGALAVHGLTLERLKDQPAFSDIADKLLDFVRGAELIIHNAPFDVGFLDAELSLAGGSRGALSGYCKVLDTLTLARSLHPGQKNSLDALCRRYGVDNSHRELHGALLDARILADVYVAMTSGQVSFALDAEPMLAGAAERTLKAIGRAPLAIIRASVEELAAHEARLAEIERSSGKRLWQDYYSFRND